MQPAHVVARLTVNTWPTHFELFEGSRCLYYMAPANVREWKHIRSSLPSSLRLSPLRTWHRLCAAGHRASAPTVGTDHGVRCEAERCKRGSNYSLLHPCMLHPAEAAPPPRRRPHRTHCSTLFLRNRTKILLVQVHVQVQLVPSTRCARLQVARGTNLEPFQDGSKVVCNRAIHSLQSGPTLLVQ